MNSLARAVAELEARIAVAGDDKQTNCLLTVRRGGKTVATQRILLPALVPR